MSAAISIHAYSAQYQEEASSLVLGIQAGEFSIPITLDQQPDLKNIPVFYQKGKGNFWVAVADNAVVGTIGLLDIGNGQGALRKMFVHAGYRGRQHGVGQLLLDTLREYCSQKGFREIFLGTTEKFIGAQRFYEKNGFLEIERNALPAAFDIMPVDVKFYRYAIG